MEKKRIFNLKKLFSLLILSLTMFGGLILSSCGEKGFRATFKRDAYLLSIGQTIDITEEIEIENLTLADLTFYSSQENVVNVKTSSPLASEQKVELKGMNGGETILYIYYKGETLDLVNITVKEQFAVPTNIEINEAGLITWETVNCFAGGVSYAPSGYEVCIKKSASDIRTARVTTNSYQLGLQDKGIIYFTVKAIGTPLIDDSLVSDEKELYYQSLHKVENFTFANINDGVNEKGTLSWNAVENADYYKLIVDSEIVMVTENNYTFSLAGKSAGQLINVEIVAVDNSGELSNSPVTSLKIKKLGLSNVRLSNGVLLWEKTEKATSYLIHYVSLTNPTIGGNISTNQNMTSLDDLDADAYSISVQAVGKLDTSSNIYYANSKINLLQENVAKLTTPEVTYALDGDEVTLTISTEDDALKDFKVKFVETKSGLTIERNATISGSPIGGKYKVILDKVKLSVVGKYNLSVQTLAKDMAMYDFQGVSCTGFLNSSSAEMYQIYKLPAAKSITHRYDDDGNSIVSFAKLTGYENDYAKAIKYNFKINGITVENVQNISGYGASAYSFNLGKIDDTYKNLSRPNEFVISIETKLTDGEDFIGETSTKTLNRLSVSNMNLGGEELTDYYTFSAINAREYNYVLYSTNSTFDENAKTYIASSTISQGKIAKPEAGYYILEIEAIANDEDRYLNATSNDRFFVSMFLDAPELDFGFTTTQKEDETQALDGAFSGYYVEISVVPKAKKYAVELDSESKGYVVDSDEDGKMYYYFTENFSSGSHTIKVTSVEGDTKIYKQDFASATVTVQKLATPSMGTQDGQTIKFTHADADLNFYKGTISETNKHVPQVREVEGQNEYVLDMSGNSSDFVLVIKATKDQEEGLAYYIDSETISTNIHKLSTITDLYFSGKKVHFTYDNSLEDVSMQLTPGIRNTNFNLNVIVSMVGASVENTEFATDVQTIISQDDENQYSFQLADLISQLNLIEGFANVYSQSSKVKLTMIVESSYFDSVNNTFVFSSNRAISKSDVQKDFIIIEKIAKPVIDFNPTTKEIYWTDTEDFQYEIKINGEVVSQQPVKNEGNRTFNMSSYLVTKTNTTFSLRKFADNYLDSDESNIVTIYPMGKIQTMNIVTENDGTSYARFNFTDILVNNKENLTFNINNNESIVITNDETHTAYQFVLRKEIVNYIVNIVGYCDEDMAGNLTYFLGNSSDNFNLQALVDVETPTAVIISGNEMTWAAFGGLGEQKYQVEIIDTADNSVHARITVGTTSLALDNEILLGLEQGSYRVEVSAVNKDFTINAGGSGSYGRTVISEGTLVKLDEVQDLSFDFDSTKSTINNERSNDLNISWKWSGAHKEGSTIYFDIYVNTTSIGTETYIEGIEEYEVQVENKELFSEFANNVKILVRSEENVNSKLTVIDAYRFSAPTVTMDDKTLQIDADSTSQNEKKANAFIVSISVNDVKISEFKTSDLEIDLSQYLIGKSGNVKVEVLTKGQPNIGIWSNNTTVVEGVLLAEPTFERLSEGLKLSSSVEEAEYYLQIFKQSPTTGNTEVVSLTKVEGDVFVFPDALVDTNPGETYIAKAYAKKESYQTSSVSEFEFEMTRLATISGLNIQKSRPTGASPLNNTYVFAWNQVTHCDKYLFTIYSATDGKTVVVQKEILLNSVQITDTEIFEELNAGNYILGLKAIDTSNTYTASKEFRKELEVLSEPTNIEINSNGFVTWVGSGNQYYRAIDGSSSGVHNRTLNIEDATEIGANSYRYVYDASIWADNVSGSNIRVYIVKQNEALLQYAASVDKFVLDSKIATKTFEKLYAISGVNNNPNTGRLCFKAPEENVTYFFEYTNSLGEKVVKSKVLFFNEDTTYHEILLAEFYDLMEFDTYDTDITIRVSISQTAAQDPDEEKIGKLRSNVFEFTFKQNCASENDYAIFKTQDSLKTYILIKARENATLKQVFIKNNGEYQVVTDMIVAGYLNTYTDEQDFSLSSDGSAISSEAVYAILLNDIENSKQGKEFAINIAYAYTNTTGDLLFNTWSERSNYTLLPVATYLTAEDGKVTWKLNDTNSLSLQTTGWLVEIREFENENSSVIDRIYVKATDEEGRLLTSGELDSKLIPNVLSAQIYVASINENNSYVLGSTFVQTVTPTGTQYKNLSKYDVFNHATKINNGMISISLGRGTNAPEEAFGEICDWIPAGQSVAKEDLPMGFGNYFENITMQEGTGTFTKYSLNGKTRYLRTADITKTGEGNSATYTTNKMTPIYKYYNIALEDLIIDCATKFNSGYTQLLKALATTQFSYPFNFTLESLSGYASENNQFILTFKEKTNQKEQEILIQANDMILLTGTEKTALQTILNSGVSTTGFEYGIVNGFYQKYSQTEHGLASEKMLFDNIGSDSFGVMGEQIQAGKYDLYLKQLGLKLTTGEARNVVYYSFETNDVLIVENCEVAPAPSTITARESEDKITYIYYLKVAPIESDGTLLTDYKLSLKYVESGMDGDKDVYKTFNITRNGANEWKLGSVSIETEVVDEKMYLRIPLNGANGLNALIGEALLEKTFSVNVIATGNNSKRLNSKTEQISLQFLNFKYDTLNLNSNGFNWKNYDTRIGSMVVYKRIGLGDVTSTTVRGTNGNFMPTEVGEYEYVMFMTPGSIDKFSILVGSSIYRFDNVVKMQAPTVEIGKEGLFYMSQATGTPAEALFAISNNMESTQQDFTQENIHRATTNNATTYSFQTVYNQEEIEFVEKCNMIKDGDYYKFKNKVGESLYQVYLASATVTKRANMLEKVQNIEINENGDVEWNAVTRSARYSTYKTEFEDGETTIAYKVVVEFAHESTTGSGETTWSKDGSSTTLYTTNNFIASKEIKGPDEEQNDYKYFISVYAFACRKGSTLEGFTNSLPDNLVLKNVCYTGIETESYILASEVSEEEFTRLHAVKNTGIAQGLRVQNGKILWDSEYLDSRYLFKVYYNKGLGEGEVLLNGEVSGPTNIRLDSETRVRYGTYTFTPIESEASRLVIGNEYTISVYVTDTNRDHFTSFMSEDDMAKEIAILPKVEPGHIFSSVEMETFTVGGTNKQLLTNTYNVEGYFTAHSNNYLQSLSKITAVFTQRNERGNVTGTKTLDFYYNSDVDKQTSFKIISENATGLDDYVIYLPDGNNMTIEMTAITIVGEEKHLQSYPYSFDLKKKTWASADTVSYNDALQRFEWTYGKVKQYKINVDDVAIFNDARMTSAISGTNKEPYEPFLNNGDIIQVLGETNFNSYQVRMNNKTIYIKKSDILLEIVDGITIEDTPYFTVEITYRTSGSKQRQDNYEYYVDTYTTRTYQNVTDKFFIPEIVGQVISGFSVRVREGIGNLSSAPLACELPNADNVDAKKFSLFTSGTGTSEDPYIISNATEFENMNLLGDRPNYLQNYVERIVEQKMRRPVGGGAVEFRSIESDTTYIRSNPQTQYFFKLAEDVEEIKLNSEGNFIIDKPFYGNLDGNGKTIAFTATSGANISGGTGAFVYATNSTNQDVSMSFNKYNSIFKEIATGGKVSNLNLKISYTYEQEGGTQTLFAGLAIINRGEISAIQVDSFAANITAGITSDLALVGIVGINDGVVLGCSYAADTDIRNGKRDEQNLLFGGIVGFNRQGAQITLCSYTASAKTVLVIGSTNGGVYAGGIAIGNYNGTITLCGFDGELKTDTTKKSNFAGIVVYSTSGQLQDLYFNGNIVSQQAAGIVFKCVSSIGNCVSVGKINNLSSSNYHIANSFSGTITASNYGTERIDSGIVVTKISSSQNINAVSNVAYEIRVTVSGGKYTIVFAQR